VPAPADVVFDISGVGRTPADGTAAITGPDLGVRRGAFGLPPA
jgi:hypothetical protein